MRPSQKLPSLPEYTHLFNNYMRPFQNLPLPCHITICGKMTYEDRLRRLNLPSLAYRRLRADAIEAFKIATGKYDSDTSSGILSFSLNVNTIGHHLKLYTSKSRHNTRRYYFSHRVVEMWNSLLEYVVTSDTVFKF